MTIALALTVSLVLFAWGLGEFISLALDRNAGGDAATGQIWGGEWSASGLATPGINGPIC